MYLTLPVFLWLCQFSTSNSFASISISWNSPRLFFLFRFFLFWLHCKAFTTVLPGSPSTFFMVFFSDNILHETYTDLLSLSECLYLFVCSQPWYSPHILFTVITNVHVSSGLWDLIIFRHKFHEISQVVPGLSGVFSKWKLSEYGNWTQKQCRESPPLLGKGLYQPFIINTSLTREWIFFSPIGWETVSFDGVWNLKKFFLPFLFLAVLGLCCFAQAFLSCHEGAPLHCSLPASHCCGFSCVEHRL